MTAQQLLSYLSQAIYLALFVVAAVRLFRRPSLAAFDTFLFFSVIAVLLLASDAARIFGFQDNPALAILTWVGVSALPLILLRLADDFRPQPSLVMIGASLAFVLVAALGVLAPQPWQPPVQLVPVGWVVVLGVYASWAFVRESRITTGLTRRRVQAVAAGSFLLALVLLIAGVNVLVPAVREPLGIVSQAVGLALVSAYFVGFAPPALLQRAWQEPVLRRFLAETPELVQLTSVDDIV
ncbi:MAG TPA: hypothetical protein VHK28_07720, partial [Candidatus Limnocylindria bacterium]|nr:hypothetical protein [Candidatus Limnocylindria bacterium]